MTSSRTLNGLSGNTSMIGFALLKQNNLSDLTSASFARNNLGLTGSRTAGNNVTLSAPYNGTSNSTVSVFGSSNSTPNTIVLYNASGNIISNSVVTPSISTLETSISFNSKNLTNIGNLTANNISIGGNIDPSKKLIVYGDSLTTGTVSASQFIADANISTNIIKPFDDGASIIFKNWIDQNTAIIDTVGNFTATGNISSVNIISSGFIQSSSITSTGSDISFNNKNLRNIGNITKQLWSPTNSIFQSFDTVSSMLLDPLVNNPNLSFSAGVNIFNVKLSIPLTYNNERFLRMSFFLQSMTAGTTLGLYLRISTATGLHQGVLATNSIILTPDQIGNSRNFSLSLIPLTLTVGDSYLVTLLDTAGAATCSYRLNCPEISLLY